MSNEPVAGSWRRKSDANQSAAKINRPVTTYWPKPITDQSALVGAVNADASAASVRSIASAKRRSTAAGVLSSATRPRSATGTDGSAVATRSRSGSSAGARLPRDRHRRRYPAGSAATRARPVTR